MNKFEIQTGMNGIIGKASFRLKKYAPELFLAAGIAGAVASAVLACKATTKLSAIVNKAAEEIDTIHNSAEDTCLADVYSAADAKKDLVIVYTRTGLDVLKLYGPALTLGAASIASVLASHNIMRGRNAAIAAAYAAVDNSFKQYRGRVMERFGEEVDRELRYAIKAHELEETTIGKNGKEKTVKKTVSTVGVDGISDYARFFDEASPCWEKDSSYNLTFLLAEQNYANDRLRARGYLFLNEVYERLGIPTTKAGQVVGWLYDPEKGEGDNYVDFRIYDTNREKARDFVNGYERAILLDFNVDGPILDAME